MARTGTEARQIPLRPRSKAAEIEERVRKALTQRQMVTRDVEAEYEEKLGFGERLADQVAEFGGSWKFILTFAGVMAAWLGAVPAVLTGGAGAIAVMLVWAWAFPQLRRADRLAQDSGRTTEDG